MPDWLKAIGDWLSDPNNQEILIPAVVGGLIVVFAAWAGRQLMRAPGGIFSLFRGAGKWLRVPYREQLLRYRAGLEKDMLKVHHPWMKEEQTLADILVPVMLESEGSGGGSEDLSVTLWRIFGPRPAAAPPRIVITGGPGSGKSVALRQAARQGWRLWQVEGEPPLVPVHFTFSDYHDAGCDLLEAIVNSLGSRDFQLAQKKMKEGDDPARRFARERLEQGRVLILIDALDELETGHRSEAAKRVCAELKKYKTVPAILTCRSAAWSGPILGHVSDLACERIDMADFEPREIRQFIQNWKFKPPKSATELMDVISSQPHVGELARNPLMLTIVAFLYSQPKLRLPENRALFYENCTRALLEEWDHAENPDAANYFDRPHKEDILGELAYHHIAGPERDRDIGESTALNRIASGMESLGLIKGENTKMLEEIVLRSGLLGKVPPRGLRFPHQTFLEYFAALYFIRSNEAEALLDKYFADRSGWREVLLLYCGLNSDRGRNSKIVEELFARDTVEMALKALVDARAVNQETALKVLSAAETKLEEEPTVELLAGLGLLAGNTRSANSESAERMLSERLQKTAVEPIAHELLQALLLAALRRPSERTIGFVSENLDRLDLRRILPTMGDQASIMTVRIMSEPGLKIEKKAEWIDGLRRAGALAQLFELAVGRELAPVLRDVAVLLLVRSSNADDFWKLAEATEVPEDLMNSEARAAIERWGWPYEPPRSETGKRFLCWLCSRLPRAVAGAPDKFGLKPGGSGEIHARIHYLTEALEKEKWPKSRRLVLSIGDIGPPVSGLSYSSSGCLRSIWRKSAVERWISWMMGAGSGDWQATRKSVVERWISWMMGAGSGEWQVTLLITSVISTVVGQGWLLSSTFGHVFFDSDIGVPWPYSGVYLLASVIVHAPSYRLVAKEHDLDTTPEKWMGALTYYFSLFPLAFALLLGKGLGKLMDSDWRESQGAVVAAPVLFLLNLLFILSISANHFFEIALIVSPILFSVLNLFGVRGARPPIIPNSETTILCKWLSLPQGGAEVADSPRAASAAATDA